jgi:hypothetical protein
MCHSEADARRASAAYRGGKGAAEESSQEKRLFPKDEIPHFVRNDTLASSLQ